MYYSAFDSVEGGGSYALGFVASSAVVVAADGSKARKPLQGRPLQGRLARCRTRIWHWPSRYNDTGCMPFDRVREAHLCAMYIS